MSHVKRFTRIFAVLTLVMSATIAAAYADDDEGQQPVVNNAMWKSECGACHLAFPPRMLPAESWRAIMFGLDKHFGSNAGLDAASASEITVFLEKNAGTRKHGATAQPLLRITETGWFKSEHRKVAAHVWKNPKVKSPANCAACHTRAESGDFNEHNVRIPK